MNDSIQKCYTSSGKILYVLAFAALEGFLLLQPLRHGMMAYEPMFRNMVIYNIDYFSLNGLYKSEMEPLFQLWCYAIRSITEDFRVFLAVSYGVVIYSVLRFIKSYSQYGYKAYTFMLFWPVMIDFIFGIRYGLACGYCLLALVAMKEKKWIQFCMLCLLATFTHFISLGFLLFIGYYFIMTRMMKQSSNSLKAILLSIIGAYIFSDIAFETYRTFRVSYRILNDVSILNYVSYLPQIIMAVALWYCNRSEKMEESKKILMLSLYFNMVMIPITIHWGIYRLPYLFLLPISVALSNYVPDRRNNKIIYWMTVVFVICYSFIKIVTMGKQNYSLIFDF